MKPVAPKPQECNFDAHPREALIAKLVIMHYISLHVIYIGMYLKQEVESYEEDVPFHVLLLMNLASRFGKISSVCTTANDDIFHLLHLEKEKEASTQQKLFTFQNME